MKQGKNKLAVFDIDGTIFRKNLHFELIEELVYEKIFSSTVKTELVGAYGAWLNNEGTYDQYRIKLVELYGKYIRGCSQTKVIDAAKQVASFNAKRIYILARDMIKKLKKENYLLLTISGSPFEIVKEYAQIFDFDAFYGSVYEVDKNGFYTGRAIFEPTMNKGAVVKQFVTENNLSLKGSFGMGDTESDASFLELVDRPIAFNPNQNLKAIAEKNHWKIMVEKKDVIYEIN